MRIGTAAALAGMVTGVWTATAPILDPSTFGGTVVCGRVPCFNGAPSYGTAIFALCLVLVVDSVASLMAPKVAFYASALIAIIIGAAVAAGSGFTLTSWVMSVAVLAGMTVALDLLAARGITGVSEQSHPMNLPVFG